MKYVCTFGRSTNSKEILYGLYKNGMSTVRFNCSYSNYSIEDAMKIISEINNEYGCKILTMSDLCGPEVRIDIQKPINISIGQIIVFGKDVKLKNGTLDVIEKDDILIVGDGEIQFIVKSIEKGLYSCEALSSGILKVNKKITNEKICKSIPFLSEKDINDIEYACTNGIDYLCISFVNDLSNILEIKNIVNKFNPNIQLIAKIETKEGVNNLESIIKSIDGIMIGRGDLGIRLPIWELSKHQKNICKIAKQNNKKIIIGTGFLNHMKENIIPSRAEVNDLYNTVLDGADEIMFSGETAISINPIAVLKMANSIVSTIDN